MSKHELQKGTISPLRGRNRTLAFQVLTVFPAVALVVLVIGYPVYYLVSLSFTNVSAFNLLNQSYRWIRFRNYQKLFNDPIFLRAIAHTLGYALGTVGVQTLLGFWLASAVYRMSRLQKTLVTTLLLFPTMVADIAGALVWRPLFDVSTGVLNYFIKALGFSTVNFLGDPILARITVMAVAVWQWTPYMFLFVLAGMESIDTSLYEVAKLEGASSRVVMTRIVAPLIRPVLLVAVYFRITDSLRVFDKVFVLTGGGPGSATETISTYIQRTGFANMEYGLASAGGVVMLGIAFLFGLISLKLVSAYND
ncbi:MAG: sugar ABC transporter permease [Bacillota bacterium]|jgi:multiple sugar transport system permease protein|nr:sugar ABC transporter permease [Bacillota bacterium]